MQRFLCDKNHKFTYPAKQTSINEDSYESLEVSVCPFCQSKTFDEYQEPVANVESVYIYELTSGPQLGLDKLLADGYVIVNRYAKTYSLEKLKVVIPKGETIEEIIEKVKKSKKAEQPDPDDNQAITESNDVTDPFVLQARAYYAKLHPEVKTE
jgi:hypothetical protein